MKATVSIPDDTFEKAERIAAELGLTRSALYARALDDLIDQHEIDVAYATNGAPFPPPVAGEENLVTAKSNAYWAEVGAEQSRLDPALKRMRTRALIRNDW